jgi:hypothetical protein
LNRLYFANKAYELSNHLGNVLSVVSDELTPNGEAQVITAAGNSNNIALVTPLMFRILSRLKK